VSPSAKNVKDVPVKLVNVTNNIGLIVKSILLRKDVTALLHK
jgi:hypothetical protein